MSYFHVKSERTPLQDLVDRVARVELSGVAEPQSENLDWNGYAELEEMVEVDFR